MCDVINGLTQTIFVIQWELLLSETLILLYDYFYNLVLFSDLKLFIFGTTKQNVLHYIFGFKKL